MNDMGEAYIYNLYIVIWLITFSLYILIHIHTHTHTDTYIYVYMFIMPGTLLGTTIQCTTEHSRDFSHCLIISQSKMWRGKPIISRHIK